jgi:hypothetical protein
MPANSAHAAFERVLAAVGQGTARQPQARAPKQFALNRPAYSEE